MEDYIMTIMKRASVFMILSQAIIHFRPNPSYEKYLKFLAGIMTIVILIIPVMEWSRHGITEQYNACIDRYMERLQDISAQELAIDVTPSQSYLYQMGEEMKEQLSGYFGPEGWEIESVEIEVTETGKIGERAEDDYRVKIKMTEESREVPAVNIDRIDISDDRGGSAAAADNAKKEELRQRAAEVLGIDTERIEIQ